jgi:hypothetical protein
MEDSIKIILDGLPTGKSSFITNLKGFQLLKNLT